MYELWQQQWKIGRLEEKLDSYLEVGTRDTINDQICYIFPIGEGKLILLECQHPLQQETRGVRLIDKRKQGLVVSLNRNLSTTKVWVKMLDRLDNRKLFLLGG